MPKLIDLYKEWMVTKTMGEPVSSGGGLCHTLPPKYLESLNLFIPIALEEPRSAYWASDLKWRNGIKLLMTPCTPPQLNRKWNSGQGWTLLKKKIIYNMNTENILGGKNDPDQQDNIVWDKNHLVRMLAWIDTMLEGSGLAHIGVPSADSPSPARKFLKLIGETYKEQRETWLTALPALAHPEPQGEADIPTDELHRIQSNAVEYMKGAANNDKPAPYCDYIEGAVAEWKRANTTPVQPSAGEEEGEQEKLWREIEGIYLVEKGNAFEILKQKYAVQKKTSSR